MRMAQYWIVQTGQWPPGAEPFRFDRELLGRPSSFEFRFLLGERVFVYGFNVTSKQITSEWLTVLASNGDELPIYERDEEGATRIEVKSKRLFPDDTTMFATLVPLAQLPVKNTQLFLNRVGGLPEASQGATLGAVVRSLTQDLVILEAERRAHEIVRRLYRDSAFRSFTSQFLQGVGTGIGDLTLQESTGEMGEPLPFIKPGMEDYTDLERMSR